VKGENARPFSAIPEEREHAQELPFRSVATVKKCRQGVRNTRKRLAQSRANG